MTPTQETIAGGLIWAVIIGVLVPSTRYLFVMIAGVAFIMAVLAMHAQGAPG